MQRAEKLLMKNAISMQEFETTQASYTNAKSAFENAQNTLNDTKLRAPFDGFIQKKYVENYQRVQPGQGVVCLINPAKLQVEFTIPETNIAYVTSHKMAEAMDMVLIPYENAENMAHTRQVVSRIKQGMTVGIFIGPEGGFAEEEVEQAINTGAYDITLGKRILRTETAGMALMSVLMFETEE